MDLAAMEVDAAAQLAGYALDRLWIADQREGCCLICCRSVQRAIDAAGRLQGRGGRRRHRHGRGSQPRGDRGVPGR
jgi:hypothetical protein